MIPGKPWVMLSAVLSCRYEMHGVAYSQIGQKVHHPIAKVPHWLTGLARRYCRVLCGFGRVDAVRSGRVRRSLGNWVGALRPCLLGRRFPTDHPRSASYIWPEQESNKV